jgi:hypothetical protein
MNKNVLSHLIGIGLFLTVLMLLVGCQLGEVEKAAASSITTSAVNSNAGIDPADRKFFTAPYLTANVAAIDPADRKFFDGGYTAKYVASESLTHLLNVDPADHKFFGGGYLANYAASEALTYLSKVDPADRKFFSNGYVDTGGVAEVAVR